MFLNFVLPMLLSYKIGSSSLYSLIKSIVLTVYFLFLIVVLIFISTNFNNFYNQNEP